MPIIKYSEETNHILKKIRFYTNKILLAKNTYYQSEKQKRYYIKQLKKEMTKEQMDYFLQFKKNKNLILE